MKDAGYEVTNREVTIKVGGMMCATCVQTIEAALQALPGVVAANVNLGNEKAYVTYNPSLSAAADMKKAIEDAGYQYLGISGEVSEEAEKAARDADLHDKFDPVLDRFCGQHPADARDVGAAPGIPMQVLAYVMLVISTPVFVYVAYPDLPGRVDGAPEPHALHGCHVRDGHRRRVCRKRDGHVLRSSSPTSSCSTIRRSCSPRS